MGLEDFATEDSLEQVSASEDDDLFEIEEEELTAEPAAALPAVEGPGEAAGAEATDEIDLATDAESAGVTTAELMGSDLQEAADKAAIPDESEYPPFDPDLDEDLFQFDELFTEAESGAGDEFLSKVEMLAEQETRDVSESEAMTTASQPHVDEAPLAISTYPAPNVPSTGAPSAAATPGSIFSSHFGRLLVAGFLIVNAAFVFFAWSASRSFKNAVEEAKAELAQSRREEPPQLAIGPPPLVETESPTLQAPAPDRIDDWIASLDSPAEITFRIARREIEEGEYSAARRRLNMLLAARDSNGLDAQMAADAEYMIAEAWTLEARDAGEKGARR